MKSRILDVLEQLAIGHSAPSAQAYLQRLQDLYPDWDEAQIQERADQAYRRILHDYSKFSVQTIDGFSQQVIRSFTYELGIDSGFRIELNLDKVRKDLMDQLYVQLNDNQELFDWVLQRILQQIDRDKPWDINRELFELSRIIFSDDFKVLEDVAARPGNENLFESVAVYNRQWLELFDQELKTRLARISQLISDSAVTSAELYGKSRNFIPKLHNYIGGMDSDLDKLVIGLSSLENDIDAYQVEKHRKPEVTELFYALNPEIEGLSGFLAENKPIYHLIQAMDANIHYLRLLKDMAGLLAEWRSENNAQLISDAQTLLTKIGRTAQGDPTFIWEKIGSRYQYFLFDEFQDTSHAQWDNLLPLLINALGSGSRSLQAHLVVGDVKQSIYRWRNGDFRILLEGVEAAVARSFHLDDQQEMIRKDTLVTNFRSEKNIIDFNNYLYSSLPEIVQKTINKQVGDELSAAKAESSDDAVYQRHWIANRFDTTIIRAYEDAVQEVPSHKVSEYGGGVYVEFVQPKDDEAGSRILMGEFKHLACEKAFDQVTEWLSSGRFTPGDIGILVRTNAEARLLIDYFNFRQSSGGLIFPVISGDALLLSGHPTINTLVAALRFMAFEGRAYHIYLADMVFHYGRATGQNIAADVWLKISEADIQQLSGFLPDDLLQNWENMKQLPLSELVERMLAGFGFDQDGSAIAYLLAFRDLVAGFVASGSKGLIGFLDFWDEEGVNTALPSGGGSNAVEILTIHKSKGLAYEAVMIPFCSWSLDGRSTGQVWFDTKGTPFEAFERIPLQYSKHVKQSVLFPQYYQEQLYNYMDALNGLYVATTRAKQQLWILAPHPLKKEVESKNSADSGTAKRAEEEVKVRTAGNLLYNLIQQDNYVVEPSEGGEAILAQRNSEITNEALPGLLTTYPTSSRLKELLAAQLGANTEIYQRQRMSALFSVALHELMAGLKSPEDAARQIKKMVAEGRLSADEQIRLESLVHQAWNHPQLGYWLRNYKIQTNEQGIIDGQGRTHIPDKVFFNEEETIVVDFKMTSVLSASSHMTQVSQYVGFLKQMGLPSVKGYLYYFLQNKLVEVN